MFVKSSYKLQITTLKFGWNSFKSSTDKKVHGAFWKILKWLKRIAECPNDGHIHIMNSCRKSTEITVWLWNEDEDS